MGSKHLIKYGNICWFCEGFSLGTDNRIDNKGRKKLQIKVKEFQLKLESIKRKKNTLIIEFNRLFKYTSHPYLTIHSNASSTIGDNYQEKTAAKTKQTIQNIA